MKIIILSASVRIGRKSHRVALYFEQYIKQNNLAEAEIQDLNEYQFPLFDERLQYMKNPSADVLKFADKIKSADGVIIVTPEYNGGYPASLKNAIDLLYSQWKRKPVAIATASNGPFGGAQVNTSLAFSLWKIGVLLVPSMFLVSKVQDSYNEDGTAINKEDTDKRAKVYLDELLWCMEACNQMKKITEKQ
ncbi:MAG: NAD(P)H-dependent oxidoreductase [Ginsengibacter sp.]